MTEDVDDIMGMVAEARGAYLAAVGTAVTRLAACGLWREAVRLAVIRGSLDREDMVRGLGVDRLEVGRWMTGVSVPQPPARTDLATRIAALVVSQGVART